MVIPDHDIAQITRPAAGTSSFPQPRVDFGQNHMALWALYHSSDVVGPEHAAPLVSGRARLAQQDVCNKGPAPV